MEASWDPLSQCISMYLTCIPNTLRIRPRIHPGYTPGYIYQDTSVSRYTNHPRIHCRIRLDYIAPMYPECIPTPNRPSALFLLGGAACAARGRLFLLLFGLLSLRFWAPNWVQVGLEGDQEAAQKWDQKLIKKHVSKWDPKID